MSKIFVFLFFILFWECSVEESVRVVRRTRSVLEVRGQRVSVFGLPLRDRYFEHIRDVEKDDEDEKPLIPTVLTSAFHSSNVFLFHTLPSYHQYE